MGCGPFCAVSPPPPPPLFLRTYTSVLLRVTAGRQYLCTSRECQRDAARVLCIGSCHAPRRALRALKRERDSGLGAQFPRPTQPRL
jgi:hypothetical protein